jgi:hypothetical protein
MRNRVESGIMNKLAITLAAAVTAVGLTPSRAVSQTPDPAWKDAVRMELAVPFHDPDAVARYASAVSSADSGIRANPGHASALIKFRDSEFVKWNSIPTASYDTATLHLKRLIGVYDAEPDSATINSVLDAATPGDGVSDIERWRMFDFAAELIRRDARLALERGTSQAGPATH